MYVIMLDTKIVTWAIQTVSCRFFLFATRHWARTIVCGVYSFTIIRNHCVRVYNVRNRQIKCYQRIDLWYTFIMTWNDVTYWYYLENWYIDVIYVFNIMLPLTKNIFKHKRISIQIFILAILLGVILQIYAQYVCRAMIKILRKNLRAITIHYWKASFFCNNIRLNKHLLNEQLIFYICAGDINVQSM